MKNIYIMVIFNFINKNYHKDYYKKKLKNKKNGENKYYSEYIYYDLNNKLSIIDKYEFNNKLKNNIKLICYEQNNELFKKLKVVNNKLINEDIIFKNEINLLNNINIDKIDIKINIKEIDIRYNNGICLEEDKGKYICYNKVIKGEDYCYIHIEEGTVDSNNNIIDESLRNKYLIDELNSYKNNEKIILEDIYEYIGNLENIKKENLKFFNKCKEKDFPRYYKFFRGYFEILEHKLDCSLINSVKIAEVNSIF